MEIRQVLKSSASMYPNLFYKVGGETRRMERGGGERRGKTTARRRGVRRGGGNDPQVDVAKSGKNHRGHCEGGKRFKGGGERK